MSQNTAIEWTRPPGYTGATWNIVAGCRWKSPGCDHCYAVPMTRRLEAMGQADYAGLVTQKHFNGKIRLLPHKLEIPLKRRKPTCYFVNSMSDLFYDDVPFTFVDKAIEVAAACPQHLFLILTKRPERAAEYFDRVAGHGWPEEMGLTWPLPNIWLGTSVENQAAANSRIPELAGCSVARRFISAEPLLEAVDLKLNPGIHWVIAGGESGPGARECPTDILRSIAGQCAAAGVACFIKQLGAAPRFSEAEVWAGFGDKRLDKKGGDPDQWPADLHVRQYPSIPR